jgi:hypothetical protein
VSDTVQIVGLVLSFLTAVFTGLMGYLMAKLKSGQQAAATEVRAAAVEVAAVKTTLADNAETQARTLDNIAAVTHDTHTLVNNNMGVALHVNKVNARRLAVLPGATAEDHAAADMADRLYAEHQAKQAAVDAAKAGEP